MTLGECLGVMGGDLSRQTSIGLHRRELSLIKRFVRPRLAVRRVGVHGPGNMHTTMG